MLHPDNAACFLHMPVIIKRSDISQYVCTVHVVTETPTRDV